MRKIVLASVAVLVVAFGIHATSAFLGQPMLMSGGGGGGPPTASLTASPASIASGSSSTLTWGSTNAGSCTSPGALGNTAIPSFTGASSGSVSTGALTTTTTYSVQCGTATAAATVTVTGGGGTVACAIGPSYQGSIPAGAAAAGFNTCAWNLDIAQFTNLNQFLDCAGASTPLIFNSAQNGLACSNYTLVTDNGVTALRMRLPAGTVIAGPPTDNGAKGTYFNTYNDAFTQGQIFPATKYYEFRVRWGANTVSNCSNACDLQGNFWYRPPNNQGNLFPWVEWDDGECYAQTNVPVVTCQQSTHLTSATWGHRTNAEWNANGVAYGGSSYVPFVSDNTVPHTIGIRTVADGVANLTGSTTGNWAWCTYMDGTLKVCTNGGYTNACGATCSQDLFQLRGANTMQNVMNIVETTTVDQDLFVYRITEWHCSGWQAATPLTLNGSPAQSCLNSTTAVTGALTGAP